MKLFEACPHGAHVCSWGVLIEFVRAFLVVATLVVPFGMNSGGSAFGQSVNGLISGTVYDQQHRSVSGATVRVSDQLNTTSQTTQTNDEGFFVFTELRPGKYTLSVERNGFAR